MSALLPTNPRYSFVIRIWFELEPNLKGYAPALRGSVHQIGAEEVHYFHAFETLVEHLEQLTAPQNQDQHRED